MGSGSRKPRRPEAAGSPVSRTAAWLAYAPLAAIVAALRRMPVRWSFRLGAAAGGLLYYLLPGYRRLARENIQAALGLTRREAARLALRHFTTLGANAASSFTVARLPPEKISTLVEIENLEVLRENIARGRGVVLAINHLGNWELYAQLIYREPEVPFGAVYQSIRNPWIDRLVNADRRRLGVRTFDRKKGFAGALALLREAGIVGVLVDQNAGDGGMWTPFFRRLSSTSTLAETLAMRTGAAVIPVAVRTVGVAKWKVVFEPEIPWKNGEPGRLTFDINGVLERQIRRSPADWFWVHNRWKMPCPNFLAARQKRGIFLPPELPASELHPFRILVRSPNWLGDACMAMDAARAFRTGRPDARLAILTPSKLAPLWRRVPEVDEVVEIGSGEPPWSVAAKLRGRFDAAVLFTNSLRSALEVWLAGIPRRVGCAGHFRRRLLNQVFEPKKKKAAPPRHHATAYEDLAEWCGGRIPPRLVLAASRGQVDGARPKVLVCPGAEYGPAKRWPVSKFRETMRLVDATRPCEWIVTGAPGDAAIAALLCEGFEGSIENLAGKTSLGELADLLESADALLTNDTGTMHLADRLGTPLVAVFGSTEPLLTGPRGPAAIVLRHHVECSPCFLRKCPLDFRCMEGVGPRAAADALLRLLEGRDARIFPGPAAPGPPSSL